MGKKAVAIFLLICGCVTSLRAQNTSSCYFCQETDPICQDSVNVAILPSVRCEELNYISPRAVPVEENGLTAQISGIMLNDVEPRSRSGLNPSYECLKVNVLINSTGTVTEGVLRTCVIKADDVISTCDFLREQLTTNYTMTYCSVCDGDKCNGSAQLSIPALVGVVLLSFAGRLLAL